MRNLTFAKFATFTTFAVAMSLSLASCSVFKKSSKSSSNTDSDSDDTPAPVPVVQGLQLNYERLTAGMCNPLQVRFVDTAGDYFFLSADETVSMATTSKDTFFSDSNCSTSASTVTIQKDDCCSNDNVSGNIFYKTDSVGTGTLTVTDSGTLGLAPLTINYSVYLISSMIITGAAEQAPGACGEFKAETVLGDLKTPSPITADSTVELRSDSSTAAFYSDSTCSTVTTSVLMAAGTSMTPAFYFKDTTTGTQSIGADIAQPAPADVYASDDIQGYLAVQIGTGTGSGS